MIPSYLKMILAITVALALGFLAGRMSSLEGTPQVLGQDEMEKALRSAFVEPDPLVRAIEMDRLLSGLNEDNIDGAASVYREFSRSAGTLGVFRFFARWAQIDLEGLREEVESWPDEDSKAQAAGCVAYEYAIQDGIGAAVTFYDSLQPRFKLLTGYRLVEGAFNSGQDKGLVDWVSALVEEDARKRLSQSMVLKLLRERGPEGAIAFFDSVPSGAPNGFKHQLYGELIEKLTRFDPEAGVAFYFDTLDEPYARNSIYRLVTSWVDVDPTGAVVWVEARESSDERSRLLAAAVDRWATYDESAAMAWTQKQLPSPMVDRLYKRFAGSHIIRNPTKSVELARSISDLDMRRDVLRRFARYWFMRKPDEVGLWLAAGGLSPAEADAMVEELRATRERRLEVIESRSSS